MGRWMVPASALGEICCNGLFDWELHALTAEFVLERQAEQQRAAAHATAYEPPRERPETGLGAGGALRRSAAQAWAPSRLEEARDAKSGV